MNTGDGRRAPGGDLSSLQEMAATIRARVGEDPRVAIILGSGLGQLAEAASGAVEIPYSSITGFPQVTVAGHAGKFVTGELEGVPVLLQSGRFHVYEGLSQETVALSVRLFSALGVKIVIVTNAAGALRGSMRVPGLMLITDHINLMWRNPLIGRVWDGEERFPDMSSPYDAELSTWVRDVAREQGRSVSEGVYVAVLGPSYETPAEVRMLGRLGADAVGMSTVPEVVTARACGLRVVGISTVSNYAAGISDRPLSHDEVLESGRAVCADLEQLVRGVIRRIGADV